MIINALMIVLLGVFSALTMVIKIPSMADGVKEVLAIALDYITSGVAIVANYTNFSYLLSLFTIVMIADAGIMVYKFVMWVLRKIPVLGIE